MPKVGSIFASKSHYFCSLDELIIPSQMSEQACTSHAIKPAQLHSFQSDTGGNAVQKIWSNRSVISAWH